MNNEFTNYDLPTNAYVAFDALSLKDFIIERLNQNAYFTDQNYEGSNLAAFIDIIAYSYHVLLFYLNTTASENMFNQVTLYENMNKIVSLLNYKPTGKQTSLVSINATADANLVPGDYVIPKFSFFNVDGIQYTTIRDYSFTKTTTGFEKITELDNNVILYQGTIGEYPAYIAEGDNFEMLPIVVDNIVDKNDQRFIAADTISVYVKEINDGLYHEYTLVDNLYLSDPVERVYELRLNENGHYEVKFGNGKAGKRLNTGDIVQVYYILSDNLKGIISKNQINGNRIMRYASSIFSTIYNNVTPNIDILSLINNTNNTYLTFTNPVNSSTIGTEETVDQIRENVPRIFASQLRLVTEVDYESFLLKSYPTIINSVKVVNNEDYISGYIQYFYDICVDPDKVNRAIINQVNFADSCDFNNVNIFIVPKFTMLQDKSYPNFLSNSLKQLIVDTTVNKKIISTEVVPRDPIYKAFDLGFSNAAPILGTVDQTKLYVVRENNNKINKFTLRTRVYSIIKEFFNPDNNQLGQNISLSQLASNILSIEGIKSIYTKNTELGLTFYGISFIAWNPLYPIEDIEIINQDITLPYFTFPYLYRPSGIVNNIEVIDE
jgi:hypothetical protein